MMRLLVLAAAALFPLVGTPVARAQLDMPDPGYVPQPPPLVWDTIPYGGKRRDQIRRVKNRLKGKPPIVIWVDSAGSVGENYRYETGWMPFYLFDNRFAVAGVHPWHRKQVAAAEHLARTADGIAEIVRRADKLGYDGSRLILVGEGWGGQTAALLGTDPAWLQAAGVPFGSIRGVILFDAAGFDLAAHLRAADRYRRKQLDKLIGEESDAEARLSPIMQAAAPNAPRFLFHLIDEDRVRKAETEAFAEALRAGDSEVEIRAVRRTLPKSLSTMPGYRTHPEYDPMLRFLREATR
jgi:arylformamidase